MIRTKPTVRGLRAIFAAAAVVGCTGVAEAGVSFSAASTAKVTHDPDISNATVAVQTKNVNPPPLSSGMAIPSSYSYSKTIIQGTGSTSASASIGALANSTTLGYTFASGTGISQSDPLSSAFGSFSSVKVAVDGTFDITSGGLGPTTYGYLAFTLGGVIPSGGSAQLQIDLRWTDAAKTIDYRTPISQTISFNTATASLVYPFSSTLKLGSGGSFTSGQAVRVSGTIDFRSKDPAGPVQMVPLDFEMSAAPPTWTYTTKNGTFNYSDPTQWNFANTDGTPTPLLAAIPNEAGARARFVGRPTDMTVLLDSPITLGTMDIDLPLLGVASQATGQLTFDTLAGNAVVFVRNVQGDSPHNIATPIQLLKNLEVINDCLGALDFSGPVGGTGGIIQNGHGTLFLDSANGYTGGTTINAGVIIANTNGALGGGSATVNGGELDILTTNPFTGSNTVTSGPNGLIKLGAATPGVTYTIGDLGAISTSGALYNSLTKGTNLLLSTGAMISHQTFDTGPTGNPVSLFPTVPPSYIFGISNNFNGGGGTESITVGSNSATPWLGFGGDKGIRVFGSGTTSNTQNLNIAGTAQLVSLGNALIVNAPINGGAGDTIHKRGAGLVSIRSQINTFAGPVQLDSGPLAIDGIWNGSSVQVNDGALGGTGIITGNVILDDTAVFSPGQLSAPGTFANAPTIEGPGTLHTGPISFANGTHLRFNLNTPNISGGGGDNDLVLVDGNITLDGILDILRTDENADIPLPIQDNFGAGLYTLMTCTGTVFDQGLQLPVLDDYPNMQYSIVSNPGGGQSVILAVPEPGSLALIGVGFSGAAFRRRRRSV